MSSKYSITFKIYKILLKESQGASIQLASLRLFPNRIVLSATKVSIFMQPCNDQSTQLSLFSKQNESTEGCSNIKVRKHHKLRKNWSVHLKKCRSIVSVLSWLDINNRWKCFVENFPEFHSVGNDIQFGHNKYEWEVLPYYDHVPFHVTFGEGDFILFHDTPYRQGNFKRNDFKRSLTYPCLRSLYEHRAF